MWVQICNRNNPSCACGSKRDIRPRNAQFRELPKFAIDDTICGMALRLHHLFEQSVNPLWLPLDLHRTPLLKKASFHLNQLVHILGRAKHPRLRVRQ